MKATALIAAALLACGTAAYAQQSTDHATTRHDDRARVERHDHNQSGSSLGDDMHRLGNKIRNGMHRLGDKLHARNEHHDDTRAMGGPGDGHDRQARMDEAYSHWQSKHDRDEHR